MGELRGQLAQVVMMGIAGPVPSPAERELVKQGVGGVGRIPDCCHRPRAWARDQAYTGDHPLSQRLGYRNT